MNKTQFINIFISPLFKKKIKTDDIDSDIHNEIIDLSNRFCMPKQILDNFIFSKDSENKVINSLKKQIDISNLKNLINQKEIIKIADLFNKHGIEYVFLKGSAINLLDINYVRYCRDIDVLIEKSSIPKAYELLKEVGYKYRNPLVSDDSKYISRSHHLPILINNEGALVELHHRVTDYLSYKRCPLAESMLKHFELAKKNNVDIRISDLNHLISHLIYHAAFHHKFDLGPVFLFDIQNLRCLVNDEIGLIDLLDSIGLRKDYEEILKYIDNKNMTDSFNIYENVKLKKNENNFKYIFLNKNGELDFLNKIVNKLKNMEDSYQTSKYSIKYYFFILVELKNLCLRVLKI